MVSRVGTEVYMSPQIIRSDKKYSYKCDIWSLGLVCYEMLTGCIPWKKT